MVILLFLHLLFGLSCAYQAFSGGFRLILPSFWLKRAVLIYLLLLLILSQAPLLWFIIGIHLPIFICIAAEWIYLRKRNKAFQTDFSLFLDALTARMKMGGGFRTALGMSIDSMEPSPVKKDLQEIKDRLVYAQKLPESAEKNLLSAFKILSAADKHPKPLSYLEAVRHSLKIQNLFEQRASSALMQIHIQSTLLVFLYTALLIFVISFFGSKFLPIIFISLLLFSLGLIAVLIMGRQIKWTL